MSFANTEYTESFSSIILDLTSSVSPSLCFRASASSSSTAYSTETCGRT